MDDDKNLGLLVERTNRENGLKDIVGGGYAAERISKYYGCTEAEARKMIEDGQTVETISFLYKKIY